MHDNDPKICEFCVWAEFRANHVLWCGEHKGAQVHPDEHCKHYSAAWGRIARRRVSEAFTLKEKKKMPNEMIAIESAPQLWEVCFVIDGKPGELQRVMAGTHEEALVKGAVAAGLKKEDLESETGIVPYVRPFRLHIG